MNEEKHSTNPDHHLESNSLQRSYAGTGIAKRLREGEKLENSERETMPPEMRTALEKCLVWLQEHHNAVTAVSTALIFVVTAIYTVSAIMQWVAIEAANELNRKSLVSVQRAFVTAQKLTTELATYSELNARKQLEPVTYLEIRSHWENAGNTPAVGVITMFGTNPQGAEPTEEEFDGTAVGESPVTTTAIGPKAVLDSKIIRQPFSWFTKDPAMRPSYFGWILYKDILPNTPVHVTEFCWKVEEVKWKLDSEGKHSGKPQFGASTCAQHNCVDETCEDYAKITTLQHK